jgi:hypothetical protein
MSGRFLQFARRKDVEAPPDRNPLSTSDAQVSTHRFLNAEYHMKVIKSVKMKPHKVRFWSCCRFALCMGVLAGMRCLLVGHQGSRSGVVPISHIGMLVAFLST